MALVLKDRVKETTTTTGTGTLTLLGASTGYQSFAAIGNGNTCYYAISSTGGSEWEVGIGTYTASGTTLSRDTILESSSGGGVISLSAGTKDVYVVYPAEKGVWLDASGNVVQNQFTSINVTGTATINVATITSGTVSTTPSSATDIANKQYVDNLVASGITYHTPVKYEVPNSTGNLTATYNNGTGGVGATLTNAGTQTAFTPDGVVASVNDRVLIYNQTNAYENGVYTVTTVGSGSTNWVLTRATDADSYGLKDPNSLGEGDAFFITSGNTGAGETYVCNTQGTITFGTTAINFVQVSSAQIYSAGTGLNLSGTTFSVANTGVTAQTYGNASQVPQVIVNAQGQITSATNVAIAITASNVSGLAASATTDTTNASNITSGTLANARTTASATNGASTIVARDASGNFAAAGITATTFTGNGANLTSLNGTAITTGTVANARTTASSSNGASTIVARDASGNFAAGTITATTFSGAHSGDGSALTNLNASAVTTGTLANARTSASSTNGASTIVARDASGNFAAGTITANLTGTASNATYATSAGSATIATNLAGGGTSSIPYQSAANTTAMLSNGSVGQVLTAGVATPFWTTATDANTANAIVQRDGSGNFSAGTITATLNGNASTATSATTAISATTATTSTNLAGGSTSSIPYQSSANTTAMLTNGTVGQVLTAGVATPFWTTSTSANTANAIVQRNATGDFTAGTITATAFSGSGAALTTLNASNISAGTLANARTTASSSNGASTIVARDASGNFAANTITANLTGTASNATVLQTARTIAIGTGATGTATSFNGSAAITIPITDVNASYLGSGTVPVARVSGSYTGITGVGTLTAGTWNAGTIPVAYGGTGATTAATALSNLGGASTGKAIAMTLVFGQD